MARELQVEWLGRVPYADALQLQQAQVAARRRREGCDKLLLLEHPPVITLGRSAKPENIRTPVAQLQARGVEIHEVARGGDVTYHGPGQLVGYLIADLAARNAADTNAWLRGIEHALIDALDELGIGGRRIKGMTGVFAAAAGGASGTGAAGAPRKIASIGVGLRGWVSYHGFALNATMALEEFAHIIPCGLTGVQMTSVAQELKVQPDAALFMRCRAAVENAFIRSLS